MAEKKKRSKALVTFEAEPELRRAALDACAKLDQKLSPYLRECLRKLVARAERQ